MIRAAVVCDNYKLPTFRRVLGDAGYEVAEEIPGPLAGSTTLKVLAESTEELVPVIRTCERMAKAKYKPGDERA